jgi:hypothetical protein
MAGRRCRPGWLDPAEELLQLLAGLACGVARLIDAIRSIR